MPLPTLNFTNSQVLLQSPTTSERLTLNKSSIDFINTKLSNELDYYKNYYGLCELITRDGVTFPVQYCNKEYKTLDIEKPIIYHRLTSDVSYDFEIDEEIFELTIQRITDEAKTGNNSGALSSFFKYYGTELNIKRQELLMAVTGTDSLIWEENEKSDGDLARKFCRSKGNSIEGGTSEIQLNIISKLILGLPTK